MYNYHQENLFFQKKSFTRFALQSECCNFNHSIYNRSPGLYLNLTDDNHLCELQVYWKVQLFFCFRNDICNATGVGETTVMCPNCDQYCPFWKLRSSCGLSELTYIIDNDGTVFFAIFMSFWGRYFSYFYSFFYFHIVTRNVEIVFGKI